MKPFKLIVFGLLTLHSLAVGLFAADFDAKHWNKHNESNTKDIDHRNWEDLLSRYVVEDRSGVNLVQYAKFTEPDKEKLNGYIEGLEKITVTGYSRSAQLAYWINLYNSVTWKVIIDHYPVSSIKKIRISPGLFSVGPWGKKLVRIENQDLSLDDIEHKIIRPIWSDDRIHYAVNCASIGCPNIVLRAYTRENTESLLDKARTGYINHSRGVQVQENGSLRVSSLFKWYQTDFAPDKAGLIAYFKRHAKGTLAQELQKVSENGRISYDYDWSLNQP
ncbi:DUF547 domain-containing protein [Candidatus Haliotispira prima]|uniref:DUF547 domain-containing protein n=1 Tax=Candidatus Haliotispira prima TaxID=3034016 RepID=A0ABY8MIC7_9SPIO|nr:DUF547 domain-containing protein [Candidatus Haliotispira prima]